MKKENIKTGIIILIILSLFFTTQTLFFNLLYKNTAKITKREIGTKTIYRIKK